MTIARKADPAFAAMWTLRFFLLIAAHVLPQYPWFGFWVSASFFPLEGVAKYRQTGLRDTMSELITLMLRTLSRQGAEPFAGWNMLAPIVAMIEAAMVWKIAVGLANTPEVFAYALFAMVVVMLERHWRDPSTD